MYLLGTRGVSNLVGLASLSRAPALVHKKLPVFCSRGLGGGTPQRAIGPKDYLHRIGRSGRCGKPGVGFTLVMPNEINALRDIEMYYSTVIEELDFTAL